MVTSVGYFFSGAEDQNHKRKNRENARIEQFSNAGGKIRINGFDMIFGCQETYNSKNNNSGYYAWNGGVNHVSYMLEQRNIAGCRGKIGGFR